MTIKNVKTEQIKLAKRCIAQCDEKIALLKDHLGARNWWTEQRDEWQGILEWWEARHDE